MLPVALRPTRTSRAPQESDLGSSVGDMATRQYQRAQDMATDALDDTSDAAGALIKADCSINWRDPDSGKLYCFSTGTSLVYFQNWPKAYIRKANEALEKLTYPQPGY
jgi:hypothetical protein